MTPHQFVEICFVAILGLAFLLFGPWEEGSPLTAEKKFFLLLGLVAFFAATVFILHH